MTATVACQKKTPRRQVSKSTVFERRRGRLMAERVATGTSYAVGAATSIFGTMTANEVAAYGGLLIGVLTFVVNVIYKVLHYRLAKRMAELRSAERPTQE